MTDEEKARAEKIINLYQEFTQSDEYKKLEKTMMRSKRMEIIEVSLCVVILALSLWTFASAFFFGLNIVDFFGEKQPFSFLNYNPLLFIIPASIWIGISTPNIYQAGAKMILLPCMFFSLFCSFQFYANLEFNVALKEISVLEMQKFKDETSKSAFLNFWLVFDKQNAIQRIDEKIQNAKLEKQSEDLKKLEAMKQMWSEKQL